MNIIKNEKYNKYDIIEYDIVDSTMNVVKNFSENTVIVAKKQESGRGKSGRVWNSDNSNNLYFSFLIKAYKNNLDYSQLSFLSSIAVRESIRKFDKKNNNIVSKWPNDVLINNKKTSGMLLEFDFLKKELTIGIGINIDSFPKNMLFKATSLKDEGILVDKYDILKEFLNIFDFLFKKWENEGFEVIRELWLKNCYKLNEEIIVNGESGIFIDIDKDGTLIMKLKSGKNIYIKSGDVF